jgi:aspartate carbamoyltransferase catalytic subunit
MSALFSPVRPQKHLLASYHLHKADIHRLLESASRFVAINRSSQKKQSTLQGKTLINMFFENSTRTLTSFELAGKRLGMDVVNMHMQYSSTSKGETLLDTAATLSAMHPDAVVVRHPQSGAINLIAEKMACSVINAGDGAHQHPTQALLDALTITEKMRERGLNASFDTIFSGRVVCICGDIYHSRVARSNISVLKTLGATVRLIAPKTLLPPRVDVLGADEVFTDMREGLQDADVVMMLRVQKERMGGNFYPSEREYFRFYGLDEEKISYARPDVLVMHPGPMNRGLEIDSTIADDIHKSVILHQVEMGVAIRQAVLVDVLGGENTL